jgi:plasmid maintenance system antidote protein VapI
MTAIRPGRRKGTARALAERFGTSPRHIRRIIAEPRDEFEARAQARQDQALELRDLGLSYSEIAARLDVTRDTASGLVRRGRRRKPATDAPEVPSDA